MEELYLSKLDEYGLLKHLLGKWMSYARYRIFINKISSNESFKAYYLFSSKLIKSLRVIPNNNFNFDLSRISLFDASLLAIECLEIIKKDYKNNCVFIFDETNKFDYFYKNSNEFRELIEEDVSIIYVNNENKKFIFDEYLILRDIDNKTSNSEFEVQFSY